MSAADIVVRLLVAALLISGCGLVFASFIMGDAIGPEPVGSVDSRGKGRR